jgi:hypothetical protein
MPRDPDVLRARLRIDTAKMLGVDLENMTAADGVRLSRACMLRLELDDIESRKLNNQPFDVKAYVIASESLERLVGGNPETSTTGPDFEGARQELMALLDKRANALERRMAMDPNKARAEFEERLARAMSRFENNKTDVSDPASSPDDLKPAGGSARHDGVVPLPALIEPAAAAGVRASATGAVV